MKYCLFILTILEKILTINTKTELSIIMYWVKCMRARAYVRARNMDEIREAWAWQARLIRLIQFQVLTPLCACVSQSKCAWNFTVKTNFSSRKGWGGKNEWAHVFGYLFCGWKLAKGHGEFFWHYYTLYYIFIDCNVLMDFYEYWYII